MSGDWKVGDLAVCVDASPCRHPTLAGKSFGIREGAVLTVSNMLTDGYGELSLLFDGVLNEGLGWIGYDARRFRKIRPDEHEDCEPEFVELLNRIKRKVEA